MTRKIKIIPQRTEKGTIDLFDFRQAPELYQYLPDIYIFVQSKAGYCKMKKMMQSANRIKYKKNQLHCNMKGK